MTNWQNLIKEWEASDLSRKAFCRLKEVSYKTFNNNVAKLAKKITKPAQSKSSSMASFIEVPLKKQSKAPASTTDNPCFNHVMIEFSHGYKVTFKESVDFNALVKLCRALSYAEV